MNSHLFQWPLASTTAGTAAAETLFRVPARPGTFLQYHSCVHLSEGKRTEILFPPVLAPFLPDFKSRQCSSPEARLAL